LARAVIAVGRYPPLYYLLLAAPGLLTSGTDSVYLMRWLSVAASASLLALAVALSVVFAEGSLVLIGVIVAVSPLVLYLASVVEPSGLEISAGLCVWSTIALLSVLPDRPPPRALLVAASASAAVLALSRASSPAWLACMAFVACCVLIPWSRLQSWWSERLVRRSLLAVVGACALALAWTLGVKAYLVVPVSVLKYRMAGVGLIARATVDRMPGYLSGMVSVFYPENVRAPLLVEVLLWGLIGLVVLLGALCGNKRQRLALLVIATGTFLVPIVMCVLTVRRDGFIWQGRYELPFAIGLPVVAGAAIQRREGGHRSADDAPREAFARTRTVGGVVIVASQFAQLAAFYGVLRRFTVGNNGPLDILFRRTSWSPPLAPTLTMLGATLATAIAAIWLVGLLWAAAPPLDGGGGAPSPRPAGPTKSPPKSC